jgi:peptide/nickel transport system permease protein
LLGALRTWRGRIGALLTLLVMGVAFLGPVFASGSTTEAVSVPFAGPGHLTGALGSDVLGRDVLARVLHGGSYLILVALASTALAIVIGTAAGVVSAYRGGAASGIIMRSVDVLMGIPQLVFALLLLSVIGSKTWLVIVAVGVSQAPQVARVINAAAQDVVERDYVQAVAAWGVPPRTVIRRHVVPSILTPLMVECAMRLSFSIVMIAGLSFLGLGSQPPAPNWGVMINENRVGVTSNAWGVLAPAILLAALSVGANTFSDAIARTAIGVDSGDDPMLRILEATAPDSDLSLQTDRSDVEAAHA